MTSSISILRDNNNGEDGSFIYYLHEKSQFNEASFWIFYNAVIEIIEETKLSSLDRELTQIISKTFNYIFRSFMWHFCPDDQYEITEMPTSDLFPYYIERLEFAYRGYFEGISVSEDSFGDELSNPSLNDEG